MLVVPSSLYVNLNVCFKELCSDLTQFNCNFSLLFSPTDQELHRLWLRAEQAGHHPVLRQPGQPAPARHC